MSDFAGAKTSTPRFLLAGLFVLMAACHRRPAAAPAPAPARVPERPAGAAAITTGPALVAAMHDRYAAKWYRTLAFVQKTTLGIGGGNVVQTWYEALELPGRLRIDTNLGAMTGALFAGDSVFSFTNGKLVHADTGDNELLVVAFDVYAQPPARTDALLRRLGFDLSRMHERTWHGRPIYVVGAARGDTLSKQFWVDRERLLVVRLLERTPRGRADLRLTDYRAAGGGWVAAEVEQLVNGKRVLLEEYADIRANVSLPAGLFDPREWRTAPHWAR